MSHPRPDRENAAEHETDGPRHLDGLDPVAAYLIATCQDTLDPIGRVTEYSGRLSPDQWAQACLLASGHRIASLCGKFIRQDPRAFPVPVRDLLRAAYNSNRIANRLYLDELEVIIASFQQQRVDVRVRKGAAMLGQLYADIGVRELSDLDLLIRREDRDRAAEILRSLGYSQGRLAADRRTVTPLSREAEIFWRMHASSMAAFFRPAADTILGRYRVELRFDLLEPSTGRQLPMEEWFSESGTSSRTPTSSPEHFFIDVGVHLYREATTLTSIEMGKDLRLSWFLDIAMLLNQPSALRPDTRTLVDTIRRLGLEREMFFTLYHTDLTLPGTVPGHLLDEVRPGDVNYLEEYGELDNQRSRWEAPFMSRLFDLARRDRAVGAGTVIRY